MSRQNKIFFLTHLYPIFIVCHLQFGNGSGIRTAIFNIVPIFFVCLLLQIWLSTSHIRLTHREKIGLFLFVYFFFIVHIYYAMCATMMETDSGRIWILKHNTYFLYFAIFMILFYFVIGRARKQWD